MSESGPSTPRAADTPPAPTDLDSDTEDFSWSCRCTNVTVRGKVDRKDVKRIQAGTSNEDEQDLLNVWVGSNGEQVRQSRFVVYDLEGGDRGRGRETAASDSTWRRCTLCDIRLYKVSATRERNSHPAPEESVEVDLSENILYESRSAQTNDLPPALPFSGLRLPLESRTSNFGRPPQTSFPQLYPPSNAVSASGSSSRPNHLIPTVHDPFFLPPPFIPSHPHLKDLCTDAVTFLQETHDKYEAEVSQFVSQKASEMRDLEDQVRCEVEMLWNAFVERDEEARASSLTRRGSRIASRSKSREPVRKFSPSPSARTRTSRPSGSGFGTTAPGQLRSVPQSQTNNPIVNEAVANPAYPAGSSLLSASISANAHQPVESSPATDVVDDSIARVSQNYGTDGDARAVAMSHVFSVLDDAMSSKRERRRSRSRSIGNGSAPAPSAGIVDGAGSSVHGKDSWIDGERLAAKGAAKEPTIEEESASGSGKQTPKPGNASGKDTKRTVKFQDQKDQLANGKSTTGTAASSALETSDHDDDHVFDLEMDGDGSGSAANPNKSAEENRHADPFEQEISTRYAAHAPSHRSAWKRPENGDAGYSWYRKGDANTDRDPRHPDQLDGVDQAKISGLATSMPVHIALPKMRKSSGLGLERKTSLSEREGKLVPSLIAAMKQRGLDVPRTLGTGEGSRRVSAAVGTAMDPGVLHDLERNGQDSSTSGEEDDDDDGGEEEDHQGTLRQSGFIPPHVIARNKQSKGVDGVRSIYDE